MGIIAMFLVGAPEPAAASYRLFELWVVHYSAQGKPERAEKVTSTLDPYQYEQFHGLEGRARIWTLDTWFCPGDTSRRASCEKPRIQPYRGPASTLPKRPAIPYTRQPVIPR